MKKLIITFLFISFFVFTLNAQNILTPRTDLLELRVKLSAEDKNILGKWALKEFKMKHTVKPAGFNAYRAFALLRIADDQLFADVFIKIIAGIGVDGRVGASDQAVLKTVQRMASSKNIDEKRLAWYFCDYIAECYPDKKDIVDLHKSLPRGNWTHILPTYIYRFDVATEISNKKPAKIESEITVAEGYEDKARAMQKKTADVNGLIVMTLRNGREAGMPSKISATVTNSKVRGGNAFIDQEVGANMKRSLANAMLALQKRYPWVAPQKNIMISFDEREAMKDGNSAGVAFTLLLYSLYEGIKIDPSVAVTGVILPDCGVKAVGGVASKVRGAWQKGLKLAVIPEENKEAVKDLTLIYELSILWNIQIFTANKFTEVLPVATIEKNSKVKQAIEKFNKLTLILNKGNKAIVANKVKIVKELDEVLELAPNHESARVLKLMLTGKRPQTLTLNGSIDFLFMMIERTLSISPSKAYETDEKLLQHNRRFLTSVMKKISPETKPFARQIMIYLDSLTKFRRLLVMNIHKDKKQIGTALNMMNSESKAMDLTRERLQKAWEKLRKKL